MTMLRAGGLLDVLTPLSDCRQESVERWNGDFGGFVYVLDRFPQRDFGLWVFMCPTNVSLFCDHLYCTGYHAQGYHALTTTARLPRRGLPRPILTTTGYHACVYIPVSTPELPRFKQTSGYRQVITPAGSFYVFSLSSVIRQSIHNNNNFSTEPGAHRTDPLNIHDVKHVHACWQRASPVCRLGRVCHVPLSPQAY